jgi:signal transduction histidine kinase
MTALNTGLNDTRGDTRLLKRSIRVVLMIAAIGAVAQFVIFLLNIRIQGLFLVALNLTLMLAAFLADKLVNRERRTDALALVLIALWLRAILEILISPTSYPATLILPLVTASIAAPFATNRDNQMIGVLAVIFTGALALLGGFFSISLSGSAPSVQFEALTSIVLTATLALALQQQFNSWLIGLFSRVRSHRIEAARGQTPLESQIVNRATQLVRQNEYFSSLHETALGIINHLELKPVVEAVVVRATQLLDTPDAFLQLFDAGGSMRDKLTMGVFGKYDLPRFTRGEDIVGTVWETAKPLLVNDYPRWCESRGRMPMFAVRAVAAVPIRSQERVVGVLCVARTAKGAAFSTDEMDVITRFAELSSVAYDNVRLYESARAELVERRKIEAQLRDNERLLERRVEERTRELREALDENEKLRIRSVAAAAAAERSRLARELHDSVTQAIYGVTLGAQTAMEIAKTQPQKVIEPLEYVLSLSDAALKEMRALIFQMRPETLQAEGLIGAFQRHFAALKARHHIEVVSELPSQEPALPAEVKDAVYRVAMEAMNNIVKHARATRIEVTLLSDAETAVWVGIKDNGVGFDPNAEYEGHLGLVSMRERIEAYGGIFDIESEPNQGAKVTLSIARSAISHLENESDDDDTDDDLDA